MSRTNEIKNLKWHETCKCECRLDAIVCDNKQRWNNDKCRCECKESIHKGVCDKDFIWNSSNCECECNKACNFTEYLDDKNLKFEKRLLEKLLDECTKAIDEEKLTKITRTENKNSHKHKFYVLYIALFSILFIINVGIGAYFV